MDYIFKIVPAFRALLIMPVVTFIITYFVSASGDLMSYPNYYLSSSIENSPASSVGTMGLALTTVLIPFVSFARHEYVKYYIDNSQNNKSMSTRINDVSLKVAFISGLSALGVASFQTVATTKNIHFSFAILFFASGLKYGMLSYKLDLLLPELGTDNERFARKILLYCAMLNLSIYPPLIFLILTDPKKVFILILSISEIILFINILGIYSTFYREMKTLSIRFGIYRESLSICEDLPLSEA